MRRRFRRRTHPQTGSSAQPMVTVEKVSDSRIWVENFCFSFWLFFGLGRRLGHWRVRACVSALFVFRSSRTIGRLLPPHEQSALCAAAEASVLDFSASADAWRPAWQSVESH